ncbi:hypothetical protein [Domibacillus indicus]|uniref:hypothetical protein n=1 Tax=Domibacillus indicus TaxID=1437523 RepID=UPI000617CA4A|nr:hypothetical protein [Domibacillus indicus]
MEELFFVSVQEEVVFPEGEEVDELLSISLDPQVTISDSIVQGSIEVTGEYRINDQYGMEEDTIRQFFRQIPVQAVLPPNQQASADTEIEIHTFDYTVGKPDRLTLEAELAVAVSASGNLYEETLAAASVQETDNKFEEAEENLEESYDEAEEAEETEEANDEEEAEEAAVQVQKRTEDDSSIFSWLEERPVEQAKWRFQVSSGNVELITTQDEEQPQEESEQTRE